MNEEAMEKHLEKIGELLISYAHTRGCDIPSKMAQGFTVGARFILGLPVSDEKMDAMLDNYCDEMKEHLVKLRRRRELRRAQSSTAGEGAGTT